MTTRWLVAIFAVLSIVVSGCLVPFGGFGDDDFPESTVLATYIQGSASLVIKQGDTSQTISLTRVADGSRLVSIQGATVTWRSDDGWGLQVTTIDTSFDFGPRSSPSTSAAPTPTSVPSVVELAVLLIADHEFWRASGNGFESGNRCIVDLSEASASRVAGSATCRGLRWYDGATAPMYLDQIYVDGQEPFDAEITFEATP